MFQAPSFLLISEAPVKSDAVVLFPGGERGLREKEANQLVMEGYANYLIIPAYGQVKKRGPDGKLEAIDSDVNRKTSNLKPKTTAWLEDTHEEAIIARDLMERLGARSALFVSSPYHMRRIRIITGHVFNPAPSSPPFEKEGQGGFRVYIVPTRYETPGEGFWLFNSKERNFVLMEYAKIVWFLVYSKFF